jgi:hypothetical protein
VGLRLGGVELGERLAGAATAFLDGLDTGRRTQAALPFDETERRNWAYWPMARRGVPMTALDRAQTRAAFRLLSEMVAEPAFARATAIVALEEVLARLEDYRDDRRHIGDYWVTVFGTPATAGGPGDQPWGVRFEGHHVSVHATVADGEVRMTPLFLGANPAVVREGPNTISAPLGPEESLGFDLLHALSTEQRADAVTADTAPSDILTRNAPRIDDVTLPRAAEGVPVAALKGEAAATATALIELYLARFPDGARRPQPDDARFAWAGATEPGTGHYYRFAGPHLLVELDNTQNRANHVHTVVRDPTADFGDDVLAAHYGRAHTDSR